MHAYRRLGQGVLDIVRNANAFSEPPIVRSFPLDEDSLCEVFEEGLHVVPIGTGCREGVEDICTDFVNFF